MTTIFDINNPDYVRTQYQNAEKLNVRMLLNQKFSTNPYSWHRWLFDQIEFRPPCRVLELGCGDGHFWIENRDRIPAGLDITLSDFSEGMLDQARQNLKYQTPLFQFKVIDAQFIPYEDESFDVILACHMLYHVPDRSKALSEIRRVLKPHGCLLASTGGANAMKELADLVTRFDPQLSSWRTLFSESFSLENGTKQLSEYFSDISLLRYSDYLLVTDAKMLADYVLSGRIELPEDREADFRHFVELELQANGGQFYITKDAGMFAAREKILNPSDQ